MLRVITYSLAIALPKNPAAVLHLADSKTMFALADVCGAPFIEPEHVFLLGYLRQTRRSLIELKDKTVEPKRIKCLARIESLLSEERAR
ncbi:MAG TPA: hypothetical protein DCW29_16050 [Janthinobacterium sp.]|nr:hypothetical protein [Janthinobacterium sp.]